MMPSISAIEGIGKLYARKLSEFGVKTVDDLLSVCASGEARKSFSQSTGINELKLLSWTQKADLFRIKGISTQYSDLLEATGINTITALQKLNAEHLLNQMRQINAQKRLVRQVPALSQVKSFIDQANALPAVVTP